MNISWKTLAVAGCLILAACTTDKKTAADGGTTTIDSGSTVDSGASVCGDGKVQGKELCDMTNLNGKTCESATQGVMSGGKLSCKANCTFNTAACTGKDAGGKDDGGSLNGGGGTGG